MSYLLDTHTLIWMLEGDKRLSGPVRQSLQQTEQPLTVSIVSLWEISLKRSLGKLVLSVSTAQLAAELARLNIGLLAISPVHLSRLETLPFHHGDPFDRLLIAQAQTESLILLSRDQAFAAYEVATLW